MSRIGKKPVEIPAGVKVEVKGKEVKVSGPKGELTLACHPKLNVKVEGTSVVVENSHADDRESRQMHGTFRALLANMVNGVNKGYEKRMQIFGTGYNVKVQGDKIVLQVGFSEPAMRQIPKGIKVNIETAATKGDEVPAVFTASGADKAVLGQFAAEVRKVRPPEPYKGKGIRYAGEYVRRKVGKAFTSGTTV